MTSRERACIWILLTMCGVVRGMFDRMQTIALNEGPTLLQYHHTRLTIGVRFGGGACWCAGPVRTVISRVSDHGMRQGARRAVNLCREHFNHRCPPPKCS